MLSTVPTRLPVVDLEDLMQDLAEVCRSPLAIAEPEVGRATLAVSHATDALSEAARARVATEETQRRLAEAMAVARLSLERARVAVEQMRRTCLTGARLVRRGASRRPRPGREPVPAWLRAWTTRREAEARCPGCRRAVVVGYAYRFMEGLASREWPCPYGCGSTLAFHFPVNSFDVSVRPLDSPRVPAIAFGSQ